MLRVPTRALILFTGLLSAPLLAAELDTVSRNEISERLSPLSQVCITGEACAENIVETTTSRYDAPRSGEAIYTTHCTACHSTGLLGAPKKDDQAQWQAALQGANGYEQLLANAINGIRGMPAKGTCMDCSDEEISSAIQYMSGLKP